MEEKTLFENVMSRLESLASHDPKDLAGMSRFGINTDKAWVVSIPKLRSLGKEIRTNTKDIRQNTKSPTLLRGTKQTLVDEGDYRVAPPRNDVILHELALQIWDSGIHEAQILAGLIDVPDLVTEEQMEAWVLDFDSWDVCDQVCSGLFDKTAFAWDKALQWSTRDEEFVKRAGFVLMAALAVHDKKAPDEKFYPFFEVIKREAGDGRNFVRKAVNWALRSIGKSRNKRLHQLALETAQEILGEAKVDEAGSSRPNTRTIKNSKLIQNSKLKIRNSTACWVANDAIRELRSESIKKRFN